MLDLVIIKIEFYFNEWRPKLSEKDWGNKIENIPSDQIRTWKWYEGMPLTVS